LPWFAQTNFKNKRLPKSTKRIALLTGASSISGSLIEILMEKLFETEKLEVAIPESTIKSKNLHGRNIIPFGFSIEDYNACDLIICRPGVGTITDALTARTPMITVYEKGNLEMEHNARILEYLGVSKNFGLVESMPNIQQTILESLDDSVLKNMQTKMKGIQMNGFEKAFDWLIDNNYLSN
jgi:UDP:flavonoid glycosyltransferase YjiC (YdhE family)